MKVKCNLAKKFGCKPGVGFEVDGGCTHAGEHELKSWGCGFVRCEKTRDLDKPIPHCIPIKE